MLSLCGCSNQLWGGYVTLSDHSAETDGHFSSGKSGQQKRFEWCLLACGHAVAYMTLIVSEFQYKFADLNAVPVQHQLLQNLSGSCDQCSRSRPGWLDVLERKRVHGLRIGVTSTQDSYN